MSGGDDEAGDSEAEEERAKIGLGDTVFSTAEPKIVRGGTEVMVPPPPLVRGGTEVMAPAGPRRWATEQLSDPAAPEPGAATMVAGDAVPTLQSPKPAAIARKMRQAVKEGHVLGGRYLLEKLLGSGGMGEVWKGQHVKLGVPIAVKTMHPHIAAQADFVRRFQREAHAASVLNHPNVVRVLDFGDDDGLLYLVMEFLEGKSLGGFLDGLKVPPPLAVIEPILIQLLDAFEAAHAHGIVHRDLKPDNVFLVTVSERLVVKVVDFGLAHVEDARDKGPTLTSKDTVAGTPEYMSPEQCRSLAVGPSADLYSIGCLLTDLLQLEPPFRAASAIDVMARHMFSPPPPLKRPKDAEPVPPLLERLRLDLLAKVPEKRPESAAEVKARLAEALSAEATAERLPTRKGDEPLGDRASRGAAFGIAADAPRGPGPEARTARVGAGAAAKRVGLWRLADGDGGVGAACETGLSSLAIEIAAVGGAAAAAGLGVPVVVLDAGADHAAAMKRLAELRKEAPACRVVVCASGLTTERMNEIVGAGAADVVRYPVTPDALGRKLERVLRRGR